MTAGAPLDHARHAHAAGLCVLTLRPAGGLADGQYRNNVACRGRGTGLAVAPGGPMTAGALLDYARHAHAAGLCVLPPRQDGSKRTEGAKWEQWQKRRPDDGQLAAWFQ